MSDYKDVRVHDSTLHAKLYWTKVNCMQKQNFWAFISKIYSFMQNLKA